MGKIGLGEPRPKLRRVHAKKHIMFFLPSLQNTVEILYNHNQTLLSKSKVKSHLLDLGWRYKEVKCKNGKHIIFFWLFSYSTLLNPYKIKQIGTATNKSKVEIEVCLIGRKTAERHMTLCLRERSVQRHNGTRR